MKTIGPLFSVLLAGCAHVALAQTTAFTYQGRLHDGAAPATGIYDLRFAIYDAAGGGTQQGDTLTNSPTAVSNGLFTVTLDFGNQFPGADRWLEIAVRTNGGGAFSPLAPRQALTSTPYAVQAANAVSAVSVSGSVAASQLAGPISSNNIAAASIAGFMLSDGAVGTAQLADEAVTAEKLFSETNWSNAFLSHSFFKPINPDNYYYPQTSDRFGYAMAAMGANRFIIGAYAAANSNPSSYPSYYNSGAVYIFNSDGTLLTTIASPVNLNGANFGRAVAGVGTDQLLPRPSRRR